MRVIKEKVTMSRGKNRSREQEVKRQKIILCMIVMIILVGLVGGVFLFAASKEKKNHSSNKKTVENKGEFYEIDDTSEDTSFIGQDSSQEESTEEITSQQENETQKSFEQSLFIGDSRVEGFKLQSGIKGGTFYTVVGLNLKDIDTNAFVKENGEKKTVLAAMKNKQFQEIYLNFGLNELGWVYEDKFIEQYDAFINQVKEIQPEATIYLQSIIYVTKKESESDSIFTNERIRLYNDKIKELAQKEQVKYIDLNETLAPEGELKETATIDGIHLVKEYYEKWLQVLNQVN